MPFSRTRKAVWVDAPRRIVAGVGIKRADPIGAAASRAGSLADFCYDSGMTASAAEPTAIFQVSDLAGAARREFLDRAKRSGASLRDTDGTVLLMLPETEVSTLREILDLVVALVAAEARLAETDRPSPASLGRLSWLAEFDPDDRAEATAEIRSAIALAAAHRDTTPIRETLNAWITTAAAMRDPLRRAILTAPGDQLDFEEVDAPV